MNVLPTGAAKIRSEIRVVKNSYLTASPFATLEKAAKVTSGITRLPVVVELRKHFLRQTFALNQGPQAAEKIELVVRNLLLGNAERRGSGLVRRAFDD